MSNSMSRSKFTLRTLKVKQGFSLVELLVVVTILGILSAIAVPNLIASRRAANESGAVANCRSLHSAQTTHFSVHGSYALTLGRLVLTGYLDDRFGKALGDNSANINGYRYHMLSPTASVINDTSLQITNRYVFHAHPIVSSTTNRLGSGGRTFYISSDEGMLYSGIGDISMSTDANAGPDSGSTMKPLAP